MLFTAKPWRSRLLRMPLALCMLGMFLPALATGGATPVSTAEPQGADAHAPEGLWPTETLLNSVLARWADSVTADYKLDDDQRRQVRDAVVKRWGSFAQENRSTIQPLINEFLEMRLGVEPPEEKNVQAWATRALPVIERVRETWMTGLDDFRGPLNQEQRSRFQLDALNVQAGLELARERLGRWEAGAFDAEDIWQRAQGRRRAEEGADAKQPISAVKAIPTSEPQSTEPATTDQIAAELHEWEAYVGRFIERYLLDEGQRTATMSCLAELKQRAAAHRDAHREGIAKLEARIGRHGGAAPELEQIKKELVELYGPIDAMFAELRDRLERIPTVAQRADLARRDRAKAKRGPSKSPSPTANEGP